MDLKSLGTLNLPGTLSQPRDPAGAQAKGIEAYLQLLSSLATDQAHEKAAGLLTTDLRTASAALRTAFFEAASRLPSDLSSKDWKFSVSNGELVFTAGQDELSTQDLTALRIAFATSNVGSAAKQVAEVILQIVQM